MLSFVLGGKENGWGGGGINMPPPLKSELLVAL